MSRLACALLLLLAGCSASHDLTPEQKSKLDARLQILIGSDARSLPDGLDTTNRPDGTREYAVIIRGGKAEEIKAAGIRVAGVVGELVTARVTIEELRTLARLQGVRSIEASGTVYPNK